MNVAWLLILAADSAGESTCAELRSLGAELAPLLELTDPPSAQRVFDTSARAAHVCRRSEARRCTAPAQVFCRLAFQVATVGGKPNCPQDLFGRSARGCFDFWEQQKAQGECEQRLTVTPSDGFCEGEVQRFCWRGKSVELALDDLFSLTSLRISGERRDYLLAFYENGWRGELNLSRVEDWQRLNTAATALRLRAAKSSSPHRRHCLCLALRGCGRLPPEGLPPSFGELLLAPFPVFGLQWLALDLGRRPLARSADGAAKFLEALEGQLATPGARVLPLSTLMAKDLPHWRPELLRFELHAASTLLKAPLPGETGEAVASEVKRAEAAFQEAGAQTCHVNSQAWLFLHRAQLRLAFQRDPPLDDFHEPPREIAVYLSTRPQTACAHVAFPGQVGADRWALEQVFCCKRFGTYAEIGAAHSWRISNTYAMDVFLQWQGVCVDPAFDDPSGFAQTRSCRRVEAAAWTSSGEERRFTRPARRQVSNVQYGHGWVEGDNHSEEMLKARQMESELGSAVWQMKTHLVRTISLRDALKPLGSVDFLSIDIEGHEDEVLEAFFAQPSVRIAAMAIEVKEPEKAKRIARLLESQGYELDARSGDDEFWLHSSVQPCRDGQSQKREGGGPVLPKLFSDLHFVLWFMGSRNSLEVEKG
ncbi:unnamed protein product [Effrenium voratum]|nr:unnamed protein product [Effrenium voratum]